MKRDRPDLETEINYLYTRVAKCDTEDRGKLKILIAYVQSTIDNVSTIGENDLKSYLRG